MDMKNPWITELFSAIDKRDADGFAQHLHEDVRFVFGNAPALQGKAATKEVIAGFFESIAGIAHQLHGTVRSGDTVVCRGRVTYTRKDGSRLEIPFANFFELVDGKIRNYEIYADTSALYP